VSPRVSLRQWNRTLLERQHLIERVDEDAVEVIDRCVGLQSQNPQAAFFALESRIRDFDPTELDDLLTEREVVRMALHRGTVFLMDALDARWMRPALQPVLDIGVRSHARELTDVTVDEVSTAAVELLADGPLAAADLRQGLARRWPGEPAAAMVAVARMRLPLVQTPPRGLWRRSGAPSYVLLDEWIGDGPVGVAGDEAIRDLIRMFLRGFGPSTVAAVQTWSGLRGLRPIVEAMEADWELAKLTGPAGETLYDLEGLALADPESSVPVRFVGPFDNAVFADIDRIRIADADVYRQTVTPNGLSPGFILIDGRLAGTWRLDGSDMTLTELTDLSQRVRQECEREAARLREFAAR